MQLQVLNSPFNQEQAELLNRILPTLTESQKVWLSGFLAAAQFASVPGSGNVQVADRPVGITTPTGSKEVTILYGSQTGNAQGLAKKAGKSLREKVFR